MERRELRPKRLDEAVGKGPTGCDEECASSRIQRGHRRTPSREAGDQMGPDESGLWQEGMSIREPAAGGKRTLQAIPADIWVGLPDLRIVRREKGAGKHSHTPSSSRG